IRARIVRQTFQVETAETSVTVSIGVTVYRTDEDIRETLARADRALYQAKHNGRDRVESLI
ncbi:MAG: diguanylate cyclase, partial [Candidatus Saccharimonadales bacterium]